MPPLSHENGKAVEMLVLLCVLSQDPSVCLTKSKGLVKGVFVGVCSVSKAVLNDLADYYLGILQPWVLCALRMSFSSILYLV